MSYSAFSFFPFLRLFSKPNLFVICKGSNISYSKWSRLVNCSTVVLNDKKCPEVLWKYVYSKAQTASQPSLLNQYHYITDHIKNRGTVTEEEINLIKQEIKRFGNRVNDDNFDAIFLEICEKENAFKVGKDFFNMLYTGKKCNIATIGKFFRLCYACSNECTEEEKSLLVGLSDSLFKEYPIFDSRTCENLLLGLSLTKKWKEGLKLLEMCSLSNTPSSKMYSALVASAFRNNERDLAFSVLEELVRNNKQLEIDAYTTWLESSTSKEAACREILGFFERYNLHPNIEVGDWMLNTYKKANTSGTHSKFTTVQNSGICRNCHKPLKKLSITEEEFSKLKNAFLKPVLIGENIFFKSKPEELESFLSFLDRVGKVDVVLDGLNIAYAHEKKIYGVRLLRDVVQYFIRKTKKVAVIGRKHMLHWPKREMEYINQQASLFLASDISQDDPFLLYTALHSGLGTIFVSRDEMRSHKFLLKTPEISSIFSRWQQTHQYYLQYITNNGQLKIVNKINYLRSPQETEPGYWHIPIKTPMEGIPPYLVAEQTQWLCLCKT